MENSRTKNVVTNMMVGTFFQVLSLMIGFVNRTLFIKILNAEYLGINSLFTNILTILSFAELGIGNAIIFNLYKPLAKKDENKINILLKFYKKAYFLIGVIILIVGLFLLPFLPNLISKMPDIKENIYIIYVMFLLDTVVSYFFTYRTSIITADQKNYIVIRVVQIFKTIQIIVQIIVLYFTHNYYLYLFLQLLNTTITFSYLAYKSKKMYPYTKKLGTENLSKKEKKEIFSNVKALFIGKFGSVILNGTDSIIISKYIGLFTLGLYSNYLLIINAIAQVLSQVFNAFTSSIGNLIAEEEDNKSKKVFNQLFYFTEFVYCIVCVCLYLLFNDFVTIWLGKEYLLSNFAVFAVVGHLYINGVQFAGFTYKNASGKFTYFKYAPIFASILNIVVSIVLAKYIGLGGVFIGTIVARLSTGTWIDPYVIYKYVFKSSVWEYFKNYFKYLIIVCISFVSCYFVSQFIVVTNIWLFILKSIVLVVMSAIIFILFTFRSFEFIEIKSKIINFIKKK